MKKLSINWGWVLTILIIVLTTFESFSQENILITQENADCEHPVQLNDTIYGPTNPPVGYGKMMEITAEKNNIYYFEKEHNTCWYRFTAPGTCTLSLDIVPTDIKNDYDFIIFKYTNANFCKDIKAKKIKPVRTNISRNDPGINSKTGLSKEANAEFVHSGPGAQFSKTLDVRKGDIYYLVVDNVYDNGEGHSISLHYNDCKSSSFSYLLNLKVTDKATGEPMQALIEILNSKLKDNKKPDFQFKDSDSCSVKLDNRQSYYLQVSAKGYMNYSEEIVLQKGKEILNQRVELEKIKAGENFKINNIFFVGNLPAFMTTSMPALKYLLRFMQDNPEVKIEIEGHVNWPSSFGVPSKQQDEFNWKLSNDRAQAVFDYLVKNNVEPTRMTYKGYGNTKMLFPDATSEQQKQKNRRVEIKIVSEK